jgi:hypothetical protein
LIAPKAIGTGSGLLSCAEKDLCHASISEKNHDENTEELSERLAQYDSDRTPCEVMVDFVTIYNRRLGL